MFRALRLFWDRRIIAAAFYIGMVFFLFIMLEPSARFKLDEDELRHARYITPDSRWLAIAVKQPTTDTDKSTFVVRLRDMHRGSTEKSLGTIQGTSTTIEFTPDQEMLVASTDQEIIFWRLSDGSVAHKCALPGQPIQLIHGQRHLALCRPHEDSSRQGHVIDIATGKTLAKVEPIFQDSESICLNADGGRLVSFGHDDNDLVIRVWNMASGEIIAERREPGRPEIAAFRFGPDEKTFLWIKNGIVGRFAASLDLIEMNLADSRSDRRLTLPMQTQSGTQFPMYFQPGATQMSIDSTSRLHVRCWSSTTTFDLTVFQLIGSTASTTTDSPRGTYRVKNTSRGRFMMKETWTIVEAASGNETCTIEFDYNSQDQRSWKGWTPDDRFMVFETYNHGGLPIWLRQLLLKIGINFNWNPTTTYEKQLVNPRTGRVESSLRSDVSGPLQFSPDGQSAVHDGYVYSVPFRKPWWAILGLPAVLALVIWRPYGKKKR